MLDRTLPDPHGDAVLTRRRNFCAEAGIDYKDTVYQVISYDLQAIYDKIVEVDESSTTAHTKGIQADALYTESTGVGLFLPVADCIATVFYDARRRAMCLAHLGRHSTVANLAGAVVKYFESKGSPAEDIQVWMAPHVFQQDYRLDYFTPADEDAWRDFAIPSDGYIHVDLAGYNCRALIEAGIQEKSITISPVNTATSQDYFSHSNGDQSGRFAVVACMQ